MSDNAPLRMLCTALHPWPVEALPGIAIRPMAGTAESAAWTAVQRAAEPYFAIADDLFARQFGTDDIAIAQRCYLAIDAATGVPIGTCSAWTDTDGPYAGWGRIHWVAVHPDYQRRGIAKALVATAMNRMIELGHTQAYLMTSTGRTGAIRLYESFGFASEPTPTGG